MNTNNRDQRVTHRALKVDEKNSAYSPTSVNHEYVYLHLPFVYKVRMLWWGLSVSRCVLSIRWSINEQNQQVFLFVLLFLFWSELVFWQHCPQVGSFCYKAVKLLKIQNVTVYSLLIQIKNLNCCSGKTSIKKNTVANMQPKNKKKYNFKAYQR